MARLTLKKVNIELKKLYKDVELVQGKGYLYFIGEDIKYVKEQSVGGVYKLNDQTLEAWLRDAKEKVEESRSR